MKGVEQLFMILALLAALSLIGTWFFTRRPSHKQKHP